MIAYQQHRQYMRGTVPQGGGGVKDAQASQYHPNLGSLISYSEALVLMKATDLSLYWNGYLGDLSGSSDEAMRLDNNKK